MISPTASTVNRICGFCGTSFRATRSDKRFCCNAHRIAYFRWRVKLQSLQIITHHKVILIADYLSFPDAKDSAVDVLSGLNGAIARILADSRKVGKDR